MKKSAKNVVVLLVLVGFSIALGGCAQFSAGYHQGYKSGRVKKLVKPFAKKMEEEAKGNIDIRVAAGQPVPLPKEFSLQVVKATGIELPELSDEALAKIKETTIEWLKDNGWTVKEPTETPFSLTVTFTSYRVGSLTGRILRTGVRMGSVADKDRAEICGQIMLLNGAEVLLDMDLPPMKTGEKGFTQGPSSTTVGMPTIRQFFAQILVDTLNDYWEEKITSTNNPA